MKVIAHTSYILLQQLVGMRLNPIRRITIIRTNRLIKDRQSILSNNNVSRPPDTRTMLQRWTTKRLDFLVSIRDACGRFDLCLMIDPALVLPYSDNWCDWSYLSAQYTLKILSCFVGDHGSCFGSCFMVHVATVHEWVVVFLDDFLHCHCVGCVVSYVLRCRVISRWHDLRLKDALFNVDLIYWWIEFIYWYYIKYWSN